MNRRCADPSTCKIHGTTDASNDDTWYAFECFSAVCARAGGVVLDVRLATYRHRPVAVACPACGGAMEFRASWVACSNGYGSRGAPCPSDGKHAAGDRCMEDQGDP